MIYDKNNVSLTGVQDDYIQDGDRVVRKNTQHISQAFLDDLKDARNETSGRPSGEFMRVASIPTVVVEKWLREGFNVWEATGAEIVKRLKAENLDAFLATDKKL